MVKPGCGRYPVISRFIQIEITSSEERGCSPARKWAETGGYLTLG